MQTRDGSERWRVERSWPLILVFTGCSAALAVAQPVETRSVAVEGPLATGISVRRLDDLDLAFVSGDVARARCLATTIVDAASAKAQRPDAFNPHNNFLSIVWAVGDASGETVLRRLVVPHSVDRPHSLDLPGIGVRESDPRLYELFIAADPRATLLSVYRSTREEDPLLAQVPALAEQVIGPLFGLVAGVAGEVKERIALTEAQLSALQLHVTASHVMLPFRRASVQVKSTAVVPVSVEKFTRSAVELAAALRFTTFPYSDIARAYATRLRDAAPVVARRCAEGELAPLACLEAFDAAFDAAFEECLRACGSKGAPTDDDLKAMRTVDEEFRKLAASGPERVDAEATFHNRPLAHFAFGAASAVVVKGSSNKPRVKLEDGRVVADPLGRQLTMALVNWSPRGYDPDSFAPTKAERYRLFLGAVLTPDFGIGSGVSVLLVRGLALNVGVGALFARAVASETEIGEPPSDSARPFELGVARIAFIGASFNFK